MCARVCVVGKIAKDIRMTIRKSIVVLFLPCLFSCFFGIPSLNDLLSYLCSFLGGRRKVCCLDGVI